MTARTWTRTEAADKSLTWSSSDGRAEVRVERAGDGWQVVIHEDGEYVGSEPAGAYRSCEAAVARRWIRKMSRPVS